MNKKLFVTALSSLLAVSALAGCSGGNSTPSGGSSTPAPDATATAEASGGEASSTPQVLRFGCSGYDIVLNPILSSNVYDAWANDLIFQGLTKTNPQGEYVEGDIVDSIELSEDKLTYTFTLKDNVTFSDGSPMTAEDVVFTYMAMKDPDYTGPRAGVAATYDSVEAIDDTHVAFHMVAASPANLQNFTYGVLSKAHYEYSSMEEFEAKNNDPMGTGPFKLESAQAKQYINLVKNENYWDTANAQSRMENILSSYYADGTVLDACLCSNDSTALGVANALRGKPQRWLWRGGQAAHLVWLPYAYSRQARAILRCGARGSQRDL